MNSLANPIDEQADPAWPSESWDPSSVATICSGALGGRHFHPSRQEWDWGDQNQMILVSQYSAGDQDVDCKPNLLQLDALGGAGFRSYEGVLPTGVPAIPSHNSWGLLNAATMRHNGGMESTSSNYFPVSSSAVYGGLANPGGWTGYGTSVSNYLGETRATLEQRHLLGLVNMDNRKIHDILKRGLYSNPDFNTRIGLNLGGRTYFSAEDSALSRFGKRFRPNSPGAHVPLCQAEGCKADLSLAKHYHRRHKVCEYHSKAATVMITGQTQRFCQQCSRFHALSEFDEGKRSCRKRLADHNRRRRKPLPNSSTTTATSSTGDSTIKRNDEDGHPTSVPNQKHVSRKEGVASSDQGQSLLSGISLAPSVTLTLQNCKKQTPAENNEKEVHQPFLHGCHSGPSLSLSTLIGNESQSSPQNFGVVDLSVPWLRAVGSSMNLMENVGTSVTGNNNAAKHSSSMNGKFTEHGRISSENVQNLLPQSCTRDQIGKSAWALDGTSEGAQGLIDKVSLAIQGKSEAKTVLSLLEGVADKNEGHESARAALGFLQSHLPSSMTLIESSDGDLNLQDSKFQGMHSLRPLNEQIYNTADYFTKDDLV